MPRDELVAAVRAAAQGTTVLDPTLSPRLAGAHSSWGPGNGPRLTWREREAVELVAEGLSNKAIAARLGVSVRTVEGHLNHVFTKLGVESRTELVRFVLTQGMISPTPAELTSSPDDRAAGRGPHSTQVNSLGGLRWIPARHGAGAGRTVLCGDSGEPRIPFLTGSPYGSAGRCSSSLRRTAYPACVCGTPAPTGSWWGMGSVCDVLALPMPYRPKTAPASAENAIRAPSDDLGTDGDGAMSVCKGSLIVHRDGTRSCAPRSWRAGSAGASATSITGSSGPAV